MEKKIYIAASRAVLIKARILAAQEKASEACAVLEALLTRTLDVTAPADALLAAVHFLQTLRSTENAAPSAAPERPQPPSTPPPPLSTEANDASPVPAPTPATASASASAPPPQPPVPAPAAPSLLRAPSPAEPEILEVQTRGSRDAPVEASASVSSSAPRRQKPSTTAPAPAPSSSSREAISSGRSGREISRVEADFLIQRAIDLINQNKGKAGAEALKPLFDSAASLPKDVLMSAHLVRGTARALDGAGRDLEGAEKDFSKAILYVPSYVDTYRRRSQVRTALRKMEGALADIDKCIEATNKLAERAELHLDKARIYFQ